MAKISFDKCMPYEYSFSELELCKRLFELKDKEVVSFVKSQIAKNTYIGVISCVIKYMLHHLFISPVEVRKLITKYGVIIVYSYVIASKKIKDKKEFISEGLNKVLATGVSIETLRDLELNDNAMFSKLYNKKKYIEYNEAVSELRNKLDNHNASGVSKDIYRVLRLDYDYFSVATSMYNFDKYSHMRRYDMLIAEGILSKSFYDFSFSIDEKSHIPLLSNLKGIDKDRDVRNALIYIGYLVHKAISNDITIDQANNPIEPSMFRIATMDKDASIKHIKFIEKIEDDYIIQRREIKEFEFEYNGKLYLLSSDGIEISEDNR